MKLTYLFTLIIFAFLFTACNKDGEGKESIDYTALSEKRLMEVSEQEKITDEDIAALERLIQKVDDKTAKERFLIILNDVKIIKEIIPQIIDLRVNPDLDFKDEEQKIEQLILQLSDLTPRKEKLKLALQAAIVAYNEEEYEFDNTLGFGDFLRTFLEDEYNIKPVEENTFRFKRSDIGGVDSLEVWNSVSILGVEIKKFKKLRSLIALTEEDILNLNNNLYLESLRLELINKKTRLLLDQCKRLKWLEIYRDPGLEDFDFLRFNDSLKTLKVKDPYLLRSIILKNRDLENVRIISESSKTFPHLERIVVEGNGKTEFHFGRVNKKGEIKEIKLSNMSRVGLGSRFKTPVVSFDFENIVDLFLQDFNSLKMVDFSKVSELKRLVFSRNHLNDKEGGRYPFEALLSFDKLEMLEILSLEDVNYPGGIVDLGKFKNLKEITLRNDMEDETKGMTKLILNRAVAESDYELYAPEHLKNNIEIVD